MCTSLLVEARAETAAALLGVSQLSFPVHDSTASPVWRLAPDEIAPVIRMSAGGKLVAESMRYCAHGIGREALARDGQIDDEHTEPTLSRSHGLLVLRGFSAWVSTLALVARGVLPEHEVHCAFNRYATPLTPQYGSTMRDRHVLANFRPADGRHLLVPVLFAPAEGSAESAGFDFAVVVDEPPLALAALGSHYAPITLTLDSALSWLSTAETDGADVVDFLSVLADKASPELALSLYKSA